jgi:hypothetical protein
LWASSISTISSAVACWWKSHEITHAELAARRVGQRCGSCGSGGELGRQFSPVGGTGEQARGHPAGGAGALLRRADAGQRKQQEGRHGRRIGVGDGQRRCGRPLPEVGPLTPGAAVRVVFHRQ